MSINIEDLDEQLYRGLGRISRKLWVKGHQDKWKKLKFLEGNYKELKEFNKEQQKEAKELIDFANRLK